MQLIGAVDTALCDTSKPAGGANCTPLLSRAYSKNADWPTTTLTPDGEDIFNTGCYESGVNASQFVTGQVMPGCFRVVNVKDPKNPVRVAEVPVFDPVNSPAPPPPNDPYWGPAPNYNTLHFNINVWKNSAFNGQDCTILDGNVPGTCTQPLKFHRLRRLDKGFERQVPRRGRRCGHVLGQGLDHAHSLLGGR
jgi:hypothetical protein